MAWLRLIYQHIVYWAVGTTPEAHHANLAYCWYELNRFRRCISHCQKYLDYQQSDQVLAMKAYCHGALGEWNAAVAGYRSIENLWAEPMFALGLAEAELHCGNLDAAREAVAIVAAGDAASQYDVELMLEVLNNELRDAQDQNQSA